ncbi:MAG: hypothetical protein IJ748_04725 [Bacteroidales bacterium]|nr:hypothetical protein [Bacteroidales bacterium]
MQFSQVKGQQEVINRLISVINRNQFPHAVLINGKDGYGNLALALSLAQYISCTDKKTFGEAVSSGENKLIGDSCNECPSCRKYSKLMHPDLHLFFPNAATDKVKKDNKSSLFASEFRDFVSGSGAYSDVYNWLSFIGAETKQGVINVSDANEMVSLLNMKPFESNYKIVVAWNIDRMNLIASNTILKILEEPYPNTVFIFTTEHIENVLPTILSRVQQINLGPLSNEIIEEELRKLHSSSSDEEIKRDVLLSEGNLLNIQSEFLEKEKEYFELFVQLNRKAMMYRRNVFDIIAFADVMSKMSREKLKDFLSYCTKLIERCWQYSMGINTLQHPLAMVEEKFRNNYPQFITQNNLESIFDVIERTQKNIDRNANAKINLTNFVIKFGICLERR